MTRGEGGYGGVSYRPGGNVHNSPPSPARFLRAFRLFFSIARPLVYRVGSRESGSTALDGRCLKNSERRPQEFDLGKENWPGRFRRRRFQRRLVEADMLKLFWRRLDFDRNRVLLVVVKLVFHSQLNKQRPLVTNSTGPTPPTLFLSISGLSIPHSLSSLITCVDCRNTHGIVKSFSMPNIQVSRVFFLLRLCCLLLFTFRFKIDVTLIFYFLIGIESFVVWWLIISCQPWVCVPELATARAPLKENRDSPHIVQFDLHRPLWYFKTCCCHSNAAVRRKRERKRKKDKIIKL